MIYLNYGSTMAITLSLAGSSSPDTPYYTFQLIDKDSKEETIFCSYDVSPNPEYHNDFWITSTFSDPDLANGKIVNKPSQYTLNVYQSLYYPNFDIDNSLGKVASYIFNIVGTYSTLETWDNPGTPIEVYKNQDRI